MANCEKIILVGFSGAGKTSLINSLRINPPEGWTLFQDLDEFIFKKHRKGAENLAELIEVQGWDLFRLWERQEFESWIKEEGVGVLAMGGGAFSTLIYELYGKHPKIRFCHIHASFETCWTRLEKSSIKRPLSSLGKEKFSLVYSERQKLFDKVQWILENENGQSIEGLREKFLDQLK